MMFLLQNTEYECLALEHWQHILWVLCVIKWGCHLSDLLHHILQILHWIGSCWVWRSGWLLCPSDCP